MNRPLVWVAGGVLAGIMAGAGGYAPGLLIPLLLCAGAVACLYAFSALPPSRPLGVFLCFLGVGAFLYNVRHAAAPGDPLSRFLTMHEPGYCRIEGVVRDVPYANPPDGYARFVLDADRLVLGSREIAARGGVLVKWTEPGPLPWPGDRVTASGRWDLALARVNPGVQSWEDALRRSGIHTALSARGAGSIAVLASAPWHSVHYWSARLRRAQAERFEHAMPVPARAFALMIWLGDRSGLTPSDYIRYVDTGTSHILAISGIHISIVFVTATVFFEALAFARRRASLLALLMVWLFALMAGGRAPALRAAIMFTVYVLADFAGRERDAPTALSIAALLFTLWRPDILFDAGFQLSFLSVASVLLFLPHFSEVLERLPRPLRQPLAMPVAVLVLPLPVAAYHFNSISLAAPLANLLVVPLLGAALWLCFATSALSFVWMGAAALFGHALLPVTLLIGWCIDSVRGLPYAHLDISRPSGMALLCYWLAACALVAVFANPRWRRRAGAAAGLLLALAIVCWRPVPAPEAVVLDIGSADAIYIHTPGGDTLLIDGGDRSAYEDAGERILLPFLRARGIRRIDKVILTHPHRDHIGGLLTVFEKIRVGELLIGAELNTSAPETEEARLAALCVEHAVPVRTVRKGDTLALAQATLHVLHPDTAWAGATNPNNRSVVCRLDWSGGSLLLTGDIEKPVETALCGPACRSDVLKVPHHGSNTSSTGPFLDAVAPQFSLISTGPRRGRDSVSPQVLERHRERGITVLRTDRHGGIRIPLRGQSVAVEASRLQRNYPVVGGVAGASPIAPDTAMEYPAAKKALH